MVRVFPALCAGKTRTEDLLSRRYWATRSPNSGEKERFLEGVFVLQTSRLAGICVTCAVRSNIAIRIDMASTASSNGRERAPLIRLDRISKSFLEAGSERVVLHEVS